MKRSLSDLLPDVETREFKIENIDLSLIKESKSQARKKFDNTKIQELKNSIINNGILQPLIIQKKDNHQYELIAGERRLRASKLAGLKSVPCVIKDVSKRDAAVLGLVENIQRSQLNSIEEALAYKNLKENYKLSNEEIGVLVGKSRSHVSNMLRISNLSEKVQIELVNDTVSFGQVKPLIVLDHSLQNKLLEEIINLRLSSREVEEKVRSLKGSQLDEQNSHYKKVLENSLGTKVNFIRNKNTTKISFILKNKEALDDFINKLI
jgi:ParB family chromosome partitioning protein